MAQAAQGNFWEIFAAQMVKGQQQKHFKCFLCGKQGHHWLACNKLWDILKPIGFVPKNQKGGKKGFKLKKPPNDKDQSN